MKSLSFFAGLVILLTHISVADVLVEAISADLVVPPVTQLLRLKRLGQKPQLISDGRKKDVDATHAYLKDVYPAGQFTFLLGGFLEHTDAWVLRDSPARKILREWFHRVTGQKSPDRRVVSLNQ
jgi:hypothetical protein